MVPSSSTGRGVAYSHDKSQSAENRHSIPTHPSTPGILSQCLSRHACMKLTHGGPNETAALLTGLVSVDRFSVITAGRLRAVPSWRLVGIMIIRTRRAILTEEFHCRRILLYQHLNPCEMLCLAPPSYTPTLAISPGGFPLKKYMTQKDRRRQVINSSSTHVKAPRLVCVGFPARQLVKIERLEGLTGRSSHPEAR